MRKVILAGMSAMLILASYEALTWPDVGALKFRHPRSSAFMAEAARRRSVSWHWIPYHEIATSLKHAVLAAEDVSYFSHRGFDFHEMEESVREAVVEGEAPRGASTISQQVAKNLWLSPSRSPLRKIKEALLTYQLERSLSKKQILEIYLNIAEFGPGTFGVEAACRRYYRKGAGMVSDAEAASLAAVLSRPLRWAPGEASLLYQRRVATILRRMGRSLWLRKLL